VLPHQERLNIAVFVDFDNIEIGVKTTLNEHFDVGVILEAIKERGEVVTKIAYADWTRAGEYSRTLTQHAIRLVQRNLTPGGDKNGADINLALDALEMAFTHPHINAYVIVGGDSDFLSLVEKLKQYDKKVFVVGGRAFTSVILQRNCHEFIAYENLLGPRKTAMAKGGRPAAAAAASPISHAFPLVRRALEILADREVSPQTGLLKSTLLQLDSTFSERNYGASSFLDFTEKLARAGLVKLKHSGRSVMVELNDSMEEGAPQAAVVLQPAPAVHQQAPSTHQQTPSSHQQTPAAHHPAPTVHQQAPAAHAHPSAEAPQPSPVSQSIEPPAPEVQPAGGPADGVSATARYLAAATGARWPMYLRNVKQILRAADTSFDERRYGFNGLMDLLRACQRDGIVRLERDRRGGLRVFQGPAFPGTAASAAPIARQEPQPIEESPIESAPEVVEQAPLDLEPQVEEFALPEPEPVQAEPEPLPVDETPAESPEPARQKRQARRPRQTRQGTRSGAGSSPRAAGRKTSSSPRRPRAKKATTDDTPGGHQDSE
jgi:uncharacterized LabA/DUF88 family protein